MSDIAMYLDPIEESLYSSLDATCIGSVAQKYTDPDSFPEIEAGQVVLIGVKEERNAVNNAGCGEGVDIIRRRFYELYRFSHTISIVDMGNLKNGKTPNDTYAALTDVLVYVLQQKAFPIILGGSQDLTFANYMAYEKRKQTINITAIDARLDLDDKGGDINSRSYLNKIILQQPSYLFNFTNIGYQSYLVDPQMVETMDNLYFDTYRLGVVVSDMQDVEPVLRAADIVSIDMSAVRRSDAPGVQDAQPNGFYGEQMCALTRFAGISEKTTSIGFYEYNPRFDVEEQTAKLIAEMVWYFCEGLSIRPKDTPNIHRENYLKYYVTVSEGEYEIVFYKNRQTNRWWMEVPCATRDTRFERQYIVPCSEKDYKTACMDIIPQRWLQTYKKIV